MAMSKATKALFAELEDEAKRKCEGRLEPFATIGSERVSIWNGLGVEVPMNVELSAAIGALTQIGKEFREFLRFSNSVSMARKFGGLPPREMAKWRTRRNCRNGGYWTAKNANGTDGCSVEVKLIGGDWRVFVGEDHLEYGEWPCGFSSEWTALAVANEIALGRVPQGFHFSRHPYTHDAATGEEAQLALNLANFKDANEVYRKSPDWAAMRAMCERGDADDGSDG
ncbi:hypothetical protein AMST5_03050 [freshwater sediment metagenome]|uniref:Uncharacterized protein n=1 Tax=freshwater sediment metagenome TaxID=556182 RepID=A0AA48RBA6_9ZZZZ